MEKKITIRLESCPGRAFEPTAAIPKGLGYDLAYAPEKWLLSDQQDRLYCQVPGAASISSALYLFDMTMERKVIIEVKEQVMLVAHMLQGELRMQLDASEELVLPAHYYGTVYLKKGLYTATVQPGISELLYYEVPYGYLVHFSKYFNHFKELAWHYFNRPMETKVFPFFRIRSKLNTVIKDFVHCPKRKSALEGALMTLWARFMEAYDSDWTQASTPKDLFYEERIKKVRFHIYTHFTEPEQVKIACLASTFGWGYTTLNRVFEQFFHISITSYIDGLRINLSKELLADGSLSLSEIATQVGFEYESSFSRSFKSHTGLSPREYRETLKT